MIEKFQAGQSPLPVYFYCARNAAEPERSKPDAVFASILRQLTCSHPDAPVLTPVIEAYKSRGEGFSSNGLDLDDSRDLIVDLVENYGMTTIVVDALDESDPQLRESLLDAFEHILKESAGLVKIFVSSRNDQDIVHILRTYPNLDISSDRNAADIDTYVKTETQKLVKSGQLLRNSSTKEKMTELIIERLSSGAGGMFRWVSLQLDVLRALKRDEDVRARLGRLPRELEQLYLEIYSHLTTDQDEIGRSIINNTLKWLLCAKEELSATVFLQAVTTNLDTDEDISMNDVLDLCNNLVIYDESLDVFRFAHLSVREFLEKKQEFVVLSCYNVAAECCLLQIIASLGCPHTEHLMNGKQLLRLRRSTDVLGPSSRASFVNYAATFWSYYCQQIPPRDRSKDSGLGQIFWLFFSEKLESDSPLESWVQWHCSHVLSYGASKASIKFQSFLTACSDFLSRKFLVAAHYGFTDIVRSCIEDLRLSQEMKDQGLLLAVMSAQGEIFEILFEDKNTLTVAEPVLIHAAMTLDKERLGILLDSTAETVVSSRVFPSIAKDLDNPDSGKATMLLERYPSYKVEQKLLEAAFMEASLETFRLLVARAARPVITHEMLIGLPRTTMSAKELEKMALNERRTILLNLMEESDFTPDLISSAAQYSDESILEMMLEKAATCKITEDLMVRFIKRGRKTFAWALKHGGKITDTVLDRAASYCGLGAWQMLFEQEFKPSINAKRLKRAALNDQDNYGALSILLDHAEDSILVNELAELICLVARSCWDTEPLRQLLNHAKDVEISQALLWAAIYNQSPGRFDKVQMLLERSSGIQITEDMLIAAACCTFDQTQLFELLLEQEPEVKVSEYVLLAATCSDWDREQITRFLLDHERATNWAVNWTENVLAFAAQKLSPDLVLDILERSRLDIKMEVLEAAAANSDHGAEIVELLLARANLHACPSNVLIEAVGNLSCGIRIIHLLETMFGRINVTEGFLIECVYKAASDTAIFLLSRIKPTEITKEILINAILNGSHNYLCCIAEKCLHIPLTIDILEALAEHQGLSLLQFFWNRYRRSSIPETLFNAAARNYSQMTKFLLDEADLVEIGEKSLVTIVSCGDNTDACKMLDLLLEQGLQADTTDVVAKTLLMNEGIKVNCSLPSKLQLSKGIKVTEDMFLIAASCGHERLLQKLTDFCKIGSTPEKWLDIARLSNAVVEDDLVLLESLLARGVNPNVANPAGETPLVRAVQENYRRETQANCEIVVQMLLSAGALPDGGPACQDSPLCKAADDGCYEVVKILIDAGASIDFVNKEGKTPAMLAKERGNILVLKYLEQYKLKQGMLGRETPESK